MDSRVARYLTMVCMVALGACSSSKASPSLSDGSPDRARDGIDVADARLPDVADTNLADVPSGLDAVADRTYPADQVDAAASLETGDVTRSDLAVSPVDALLDGYGVADCDGRVDQGCACNSVAPGEASSLAVSDTLGKLVPDPSACLLYALTTTAPSHLLVYDTAKKQELARVALGGLAMDFDLSPNGAHLVVAMGSLKQIAVVNKGSWTVTPVATKYDVEMIEISNNGNGFYYSREETKIQRINLTLGSTRELTGVQQTIIAPDLELSADGASLYFGNSKISASHLFRLDVVTPRLITTSPVVDVSRWNDDHGFQAPKRHVYLGPSGKHIYFANYQLDTAQLALVLGKSGQIFAEDAAATFAVSDTGIVDAQLLTSLATFPNPITAAALTAADTELWYYSPTTGRLSYANVDDFIEGKTLGVREATARPITDYTFAKLVADPNRPVLYGLDTTKRVVVSIDSHSGLALQSVVVGSRPVDLEIDASGSNLYAGHLDTLAVAQIDARKLTFGRFITTPRVPNDIVLLSGDRIAMIDEDQWTKATLFDLVTGKTLDYSNDPNYEGVLAATADGNSLFVTDTHERLNVTRYDVSAGKLRQVAHTEDYGGGPGLVVTPDGTSVYVGDHCLDGSNLTDLRYEQHDRIYSVTPNGKLAISAGKVYRVADGATLATLPSNCAVQAVSPDGSTLYCAVESGIVTFPLGGLQ